MKTFSFFIHINHIYGFTDLRFAAGAAALSSDLLTKEAARKRFHFNIYTVNIISFIGSCGENVFICILLDKFALMKTFTLRDLIANLWF